MNQILYIENKKNKPSDIKKVIIFFSISIIIFGIVLVGQGSYAMFFKNTEHANILNNNTVTDDKKPEININREEDNVIINVKHNKQILRVLYTWNNEADTTIEGNNRTEITEKIVLPIGTNTLHLKVIDIDEKQTEFEKEYIVEGDGKPVIGLYITSENKIKIIAVDEQSLKNIIYTWNNGQETKIEANLENLKQIEKEVEIPLGQNTLKVTATNIKDVVSTKELEVKGIKKPIVTVQRDGDSLVIIAEDESGMKLVDYTLNDKKYQLNFGDVKVIKYRQKLVAGENLIILKAYNKDGGVTEYKGKCVN